MARSVEALAAAEFGSSSNTYIMKVVKPEAHDTADAKSKVDKAKRKLSGVPKKR